MLRLAIAGTVLLAFVSGARADAPQAGTRGATRGAAAARSAPALDEALLARIVDIQQTLDRILAETTPAPAGTTGASKPSVTEAPGGGSGTVAVDRARLLQLRRQLDALLGVLKSR